MPKRWVCSQGKFLIQDWVYFDSTVYIWPRCHNKEHVNLWPKILRKTCSSLVKLFLTERLILHNISTISCKKEVLKIRAKCKSANIGSSTVQLNGRLDRYSSSKLIDYKNIVLYHIKRR